ncbi:MAG: diphosphate--fructose-6-phosphate 1-phosphotransferase [Puniceicoccales bacterium]|jgi:6-phosphofructokinase 1|nr:diphosphate--fructose-6-phosphate 1-phosphotransferase [Puniceicoccales bacterium]
MEMSLKGNLLVTQLGSLSSASNASLSGIITEALDHECIEEIYGGLQGVQGILGEKFIDLAAESQQSIRALKTTPGAALGIGVSSAQRTEEWQRILNIFQTHNIHYFFTIGNHQAQEVASKIHQQAQASNFPLQVLAIPHSVENDLSATDHCLGYGSAVKYIATTVREVAMDSLSAGIPHLVSIIEVDGHHTGWLAAGASLAKRKDHPEDAPHIIYLPEVVFSKEQLLNDVQTVLQSSAHCIIVVAEGIADAEGNFISAKAHLLMEGRHTTIAISDILKAMITSELSVPVRTIKLGSTPQTAAHCSSQTDIDEAFECGRHAVKFAIEGASGKMLTLLREEGNHYAVKFDLTDLQNMSQAEKTFPLNWLEEDGCRVQSIFSKYTLPLIRGHCETKDDEGLPIFNFLKKIPVKTLS